jgi:hypothetical protein
MTSFRSIIRSLAIVILFPPSFCQRPANCQARAYSPSAATVRVSEVTLFGDMDCFKVETPTATYLYGKKGAGFARILDKEGHDWVSYRPGDRAKGGVSRIAQVRPANEVFPLRLWLRSV